MITKLKQIFHKNCKRYQTEKIRLDSWVFCEHFKVCLASVGESMKELKLLGAEEDFKELKPALIDFIVKKKVLKSLKF